MIVTSDKTKRKIIYSCWSFEKSDDSKSLAFWWAPITLLICIFLYGMIYVSFKSLPTSLTVYDEAVDQNRFIGDVAHSNLQILTRFGPKIGGSIESDVYAVNFLENAIKNIISLKHPSKEIDLLSSFNNGSLMIGSSLYVYQNLYNIVVRLRPSGQNVPEHSLLINSHYDTVPTSPGAGDAGSMIVVMLEILRVLAKSSEFFKHSIIFLFNGSEETNLAGSHAFITQSGLRFAVRAVINLDAAGNGGREIMFQAGPMHPWLMKHYRNSAPHPFSSAMGEELFQANFVPSDTDFRIFRDYGNIPGMDFAYSTNGYVYHTKYDSIETVSAGTLQHTGDNILALTKALANAPEMENTREHAEGKVVFYDFLGWFLVFYTETQGVILNSVISCVSIIMIFGYLFVLTDDENTFLKVLCEFGVIIIIQLISIAIGAGLSIGAGYWHDGIDYSMSWFAQPWLIFGLYFCPCIFGLTLGPMLYRVFRRNTKLDVAKRTQLFLNAHCLFFDILLIGLTILAIRSAFIIMISVFFYTIFTIINFVLLFLTKKKILKKIKFQFWIIVHLIGQLLPFSFYSYLSIIAFSTFIPFAGRNGPNDNPEMIISYFSILMTLLLAGFLAPFFVMFKSPRIMFLGSVIIYLGTLILVFIIGFPFHEATAPQRHNVYHFHHIHQEFESDQEMGKKSGISIGINDRHSLNYLTGIVYNISFITEVQSFCEEEFTCEMPFYASSVYGGIRHVIATDPPTFPFEVALLPVETSVPNEYVFNLYGPTHMRIFLSPRAGITLNQWSFSDGTRYATNRRNRYIYHINFYQGGTLGLPHPIRFSLNVPENWSGPKFDIGIAGQYLGDRYPKTNDFINFIYSFPQWTHVAATVSQYKSYTY